MDTRTCPHCDAPLKPAARFCLACDQPVGDEDSRLSVAEPQGVVGRSWTGLAVAAAVLIALGAVSWAALHMVQTRHAAAAAQAAGDARRGIVLLVRAESGASHACEKSSTYVAGIRKVERQQCVGIVDADPGVRLEHVHVDQVKLESETGIVRVTGEIVDSQGTRPFKRTVHLVDQAGVWAVSWNGKPVI